MAMNNEEYDVDMSDVSSVDLDKEMYSSGTSGKSSSQKTNRKERKTNQNSQSNN